jgi:hypothetical protein
MLKCGLNAPTLCHTKNGPFLGVFGTKGSIGARCSPLLTGINRRPNLCRQERDLHAFAKKARYKVVRGLEGNASGAKQEVLALAQARKVDVILVTELTARAARLGLPRGP